MLYRVFIAVDIEDPILIEKFTMMSNTLASTGVPMKLVEGHNLHITLRFIGEVDRGIVDRIIGEVLKPLSFNRFRVMFKGLGGFPTGSRPRVIWVGVEQGFDELKSIREWIEGRLRAIGIKPEGREFKPHLTLARVKGSRNLHSLVRLLQEYSDYEFGWMTVDRVRLKKSTLTRHGPIYDTLWEARLA